MDYLTLKGLRFEGKHGFYEEERKRGNIFEVDLKFRLDLRSAAAADEINQTVDYQSAEQIVKKIMHGTSVRLIETLTFQIGEELFQTFSEVQYLEVKVRKLNPPLETVTEYSEVTMTWQR